MDDLTKQRGSAFVQQQRSVSRRRFLLEVSYRAYLVALMLALNAWQRLGVRPQVLGGDSSMKEELITDSRMCRPPFGRITHERQGTGTGFFVSTGGFC